MTIVPFIIAILFGYLIGCFNPAYFISKLKHESIKSSGTKNLGTTNVMLHFGKRWGMLTLFIDLVKPMLCVSIAKIIYPSNLEVKILAGCASILGQIFPFYLNFKGGKGVASFVGFMLVCDWKLCIILVAISFVIMLILNYACVLSFICVITFPILFSLKTQSLSTFFIIMAVSVVVMIKHVNIVSRIFSGNEIRVRQSIKKLFVKESDSENE